MGAKTLALLAVLSLADLNGQVPIPSGKIGTGSGIGTVSKPSVVSTQILAAPGAPTVTPTCASACTATWTYKIVAKVSDGTSTEAGAAGSTAAQNATIDATNFNTLTWTAVSGATSYDVYRTVSGGTPASLGKIGNVVAATIVDNGLAGDASTAPVNNSTGRILSSAYGTATNCSSSASPAVCGSASAGSVTVAAAATTKVVNTTAVTADSQILLLFDSSLGTKLGVTCNTTIVDAYGVTARTAAVSFTITVGTAPATNPACFSYFIVN